MFYINFRQSYAGVEIWGYREGIGAMKVLAV